MTWELIEYTQEDDHAINVLQERKTRFRADHNFSVRIVRALRSAGYDVVVSKHGHLERAIDRAHHNAAFYENRMLLTHDKDLLDEKRYPRDNTEGCAVLPGGGGNDVEIALALDFLLDLIGPSKRLWRGSLLRLHRSGVLEVRDVDANSGERETLYYKSESGNDYLWTGAGAPPGLDRA